MRHYLCLTELRHDKAVVSLLRSDDRVNAVDQTLRVTDAGLSPEEAEEGRDA